MNYSAEGICGRKHRVQEGGHASRNTQQPIDHSLLLFAARISSIGSNCHNKNSLRGEKNTHQDTHQISGQTAEAKNVNINTTDDGLLAFTMVQQIMIELSGAMTKIEKCPVITKVVFRLMKNNANNSS
jgi:hypothetical protein